MQNKLTIAIAILALVLASPAFATTEISDCNYLSIPNETYILINDIINSSSSTCMQFNANNITLDCQGHIIDGIDTTNSKGIITDKNHSTIKNCIVRDYYTAILFAYNQIGEIINNTALSGTIGISLYYSQFFNILDNNVSEMATYGIRLEHSDNNFLANNKVTNSLYGLFLPYSNNVSIANNIAENNTEWDIYSNREKIATNITSWQNIFSFHGSSPTLKGISQNDAPNDANGKHNISRWINASVPSGAWLYINFSYDDNEIGLLNESTLRIWKYNGTWTNESFYSANGVDTEANIVYANITGEMSAIFAPLGDNLPYISNSNCSIPYEYLNETLIIVYNSSYEGTTGNIVNATLYYTSYNIIYDSPTTTDFMMLLVVPISVIATAAIVIMRLI